MFLDKKRMITVSTCVDSAPVVEESLEWIKKCSTTELTHIMLVDNGSYEPIPKFSADILWRLPYNVGVNAISYRVLPYLEDLEVEFVAFFHNDFIIEEIGWDKRVIEAFDADPNLALLGTVGSDTMEANGGRGSGTRLSFVGVEKFRTGWTGGPAERHGYRSVGIQPAANLDHCSMIFRVSALKQIPPQEGNYAMGHYYDRACCCELIERNWRVATIDLPCDHFSGGTGLCKAPGEHVGVRNRANLYAKWLSERGIPFDPANPDMAMYITAQQMFMQKWYIEKQFVPFRINPDYSITKL